MNKSRVYATSSKDLIYKIIGYISALVLFAGIVALFGFTFFSSSRPDKMVCIRYETVTNGGRFTPIGQQRCVLDLEIVETQVERELGLSGRQSMATSQGMLFVFDTIGSQCIWMKDMKFPIDIVWADSKGIVIKVLKNVPPDSYPQQFCVNDSLFVIEVAAGVSQIPELQPGAHINL